jgi:hypothetical protein
MPGPLPEDETGVDCIQPSCRDGEGRFYCIEHECYTWDGDPHLCSGDDCHTLLWVCAEHGPEVPIALPDIPGVSAPYHCVLHQCDMASLHDPHLATEGIHVVTHEGDTYPGEGPISWP